MEDIMSTKLQIKTDVEINKYFAEYLGYNVKQYQNVLFIIKDGKKQLPWMPNFDLNQLFEVKRRIEQNGLKISLYGDFFELTKNEELIFAHHDRSQERALYIGLYKFLSRFE